jgi:hypothetical protein
VTRSVPWRKILLLLLVSGAMLAAIDAMLGWMLRRSLLPAGLAAQIHGTSTYTRLVADALPTREPGLDVTYPVDRESYGDLIDKGQVATGVPSGDGIEEVRLLTDAFGFRAVQHHEGCDVLILGDSFTEAANLGERDAYPLILDRQRPERICNLSIAAVGTLQQRDFLERWGIPRSPRWVVLAFFEGNDLEDNFNYTRILNRLGEESALRTFLRRRPLLRLARSVMAADPSGDSRDVETRIASTINPVRGEIAGRPLILGFYNAYIERLARPTDEIVASEAWVLTREYLDDIATECRRAGVPLAIAFLPSKPHVYLRLLLDSVDSEALHRFAGRTSETPEAFIARLEANADALRELVRRWTHERDVEFIDPVDRLVEEAARGRKLFLSWDTHMNAEGHQVLTSLLGDALGDRLASASAADAAPPPTR